MTATTSGPRPVLRSSSSRSLATGQRAVHDPSLTYPLWPPQTAGCPRSSTEQLAYPLEVDYDYDAIANSALGRLFDRNQMPADVGGWSELLPPLVDDLAAGIGSTPLLQGPQVQGVQLLVKDESRNPTWSHKDRLNLCTVSAAAISGAPGVVVASSGNHGASAAALAARAGLPCVVVMAENGPALPQSFVAAYGAVVLPVSSAARWSVVRDIVDRLGFQPLSNQTNSHTGHPFGPEGYKTLAYELYLQLGHRVPAAVFIPTGYAELLYGVWKGFEELVRFGVVQQAPALFACEVASRGVLAEGVRTGDPSVIVEPTPTDAYSVASSVGGYRGLHVMRHTTGTVVGVDDPAMVQAQDELASLGLWQELSGVIGVAGARQVIESGMTFDGPVVCIATSAGLKDKNALRYLPAPASADWSAIASELRRHGVSTG